MVILGAGLSGCHATHKAAGAPSPERRQIIHFARKHLGTPYVYGGSNPQGGFDCSGFVHYVYGRFGVSLPRTSATLAGAGKTISLKRAQPADLIFFTGSNASGPIGHVGIITHAAGAHTEFIHASSGAKSGGVVVSTLSNSYYNKRFVKVVNVL